MFSEVDTLVLQHEEAMFVLDSAERTLGNHYYLPERRNYDVNMTIETTFEFKFSRDLIRFVLKEYMTGLRWISTGMFTEHNLDSPFTPQCKEAIKEELDSNGHTFHELYDFYFPDKSKVAEYHTEKCKIFKDMFVDDMFTPEDFIAFCAHLGMTTGLSYLYGARLAPYQSFLLLITAIQEIKHNEKIDDDFWNVIQDWVELPE